jgi:hypothetical protein
MTPEEFVRQNNLQRQLRRAAGRNRQVRREVKKAGVFDHRTASGIIIPDPEPSPEHYHHIYSIPGDGISMPRWAVAYLDVTDARKAMQEIAQQAEPNVEWYEDGRIGLEMAMAERTGLFWVILEVAACVRSTCAPTVRRENVKRSLVVMPGGRKAKK